jgi:D-3-phosphoglycerate dehydrogenase
MTSLRIAVLDDFADVFRTTPAAAKLAQHAVQVFRQPYRSTEELVRWLQPFDAILLTQQRTALPGPLLEQLPRLRLIAQTGSHSSHIDLAACARRGIAFRTGGKGGFAGTVELTWALILAALRNIPFETARLRAGHWQSTIGTTLAGKRLGVYGFGRIGSRVAAIGAAMEMDVVCLVRDGAVARVKAAGLQDTQERAAFFAEVDVLTLHLSLNEETRGIVTGVDLARMKPSALLVNTSRAGLIAPGALLAALLAGQPGRAAIDVFEQEPVLDAADPLLELDQVLATPHLGYTVREQLAPLFDAAADEILAFATES